MDVFIFYRSPQSLNHDVIHSSALAVHADPDTMGFQDTGERTFCIPASLSVLNISGGL
jgi:hypothetical protein